MGQPLGTNTQEAAKLSGEGAERLSGGLQRGPVGPAGYMTPTLRVLALLTWVR